MIGLIRNLFVGRWSLHLPILPSSLPSFSLQVLLPSRHPRTWSFETLSGARFRPYQLLCNQSQILKRSLRPQEYLLLYSHAKMLRNFLAAIDFEFVYMFGESFIVLAICAEIHSWWQTLGDVFQFFLKIVKCHCSSRRAIFTEIQKSRRVCTWLISILKN